MVVTWLITTIFYHIFVVMSMVTSQLCIFAQFGLQYVVTLDITTKM